MVEKQPHPQFLDKTSKTNQTFSIKRNITFMPFSQRKLKEFANLIRFSQSSVVIT